MRSIKFRYWDMVRKEFITDCDVYFVAEDIIFAGDLNNLPLVDVTGKVQMSQYTGLEDKNGREIYEGDILNIWIDGYKQGNPYIVETMEELYLELNRDDGYYRIQNFEVIGNIYENPNLLEGEQDGLS